MPREPTAAAALYPHLPRATVSTPDAPRRNVSALAASMYPNLVPKPPPAPAPRRRFTREEENRWWANADPEWARMFGLVKVR
jgi:hypothetical protein